jgi:hypothetical protein
VDFLITTYSKTVIFNLNLKQNVVSQNV